MRPKFLLPKKFIHVGYNLLLFLLILQISACMPFGGSKSSGTFNIPKAHPSAISPDPTRGPGDDDGDDDGAGGDGSQTPTPVPTGTNSSPTPTPSATASGVTFAQLRTQIFNSRCVQCHSFLTSEAQTRSYLQPGYPESSALYLRVKNNNMPPSGAALTQNQKDLIFNYIRDL